MGQRALRGMSRQGSQEAIALTAHVDEALVEIVKLELIRCFACAGEDEDCNVGGSEVWFDLRSRPRLGECKMESPKGGKDGYL